MSESNNKRIEWEGWAWFLLPILVMLFVYLFPVRTYSNGAYYQTFYRQTVWDLLLGNKGEVCCDEKTPGHPESW